MALGFVSVIDTVQVYLPQCPLTTVRSRYSADELQIVRAEALKVLSLSFYDFLWLP